MIDGLVDRIQKEVGRRRGDRHGRPGADRGQGVADDHPARTLADAGGPPADLRAERAARMPEDESRPDRPTDPTDEERDRPARGGARRPPRQARTPPGARRRAVRAGVRRRPRRSPICATRSPTSRPATETGERVAVAGRVMLLRRHGKLAFATIRDRDGATSSCSWREDTLDADGFALVEDLGPRRHRRRRGPGRDHEAGRAVGRRPTG